MCVCLHVCVGVVALDVTCDGCRACVPVCVACEMLDLLYRKIAFIFSAEWATTYSIRYMSANAYKYEHPLTRTQTHVCYASIFRICQFFRVRLQCCINIHTCIWIARTRTFTYSTHVRCQFIFFQTAGCDDDSRIREYAWRVRHTRRARVPEL